MIWTIAKREFLDNVISFRFAAGSIACIILVVFSTLIGVERYKLELESYSSIAKRNEEKLRKKISLEDFWDISLKALRRPGVLSVVTRGGGATQPYGVSIWTDRVPIHHPRGKRENEYLNDLIDFDVTKAVKIVMSLLALLISFDVISGEKERGLLRLQLSNTVSRGQLFLGKYIGASITLAFPVVFCLLLSLMIISLLFPIPLTFSSYLRLGILFIIYMIFLSAMLLFGFLLSSLTHRSATSLAFSLMAWLLFVQIIPNGGTFLAQRLVPVPSRESTHVEVRKLGAEFEERERAFWDWESNPEPSMEKEAEIYAYSNHLWTEVFSGERYEIEKGYMLKLQRQVRIAEILSGISPVFLVEKVSQTLSHTSVADYERFLEQARIYQRELMKFVKENGFFSKKELLEMIRFWKEEKEPPKDIDMNQIPPFKYQELDLSGSFKATLIPVVVLILLNGLLFGLTLAIFLRYDVR